MVNPMNKKTEIADIFEIGVAIYMFSVLIVGPGIKFTHVMMECWASRAQSITGLLFVRNSIVVVIFYGFMMYILFEVGGGISALFFNWLYEILPKRILCILCLVVAFFIAGIPTKLMSGILKSDINPNYSIENEILETNANAEKQSNQIANDEASSECMRVEEKASDNQEIEKVDCNMKLNNN